MLHDATGRLLAESIYSDRDLPPFDQVRMDGIAISFDRWLSGQREFVSSGIQRAGIPALKPEDATTCMEVMTGAVIPEGTDTVIPYEKLEAIGEASAPSGFRIPEQPLTKGQHVHRRAADFHKGDLLVSAGSLITPAVAGIAASCGKDRLLVRKMPQVTVIATGDELVDVADTPRVHQIRSSNAHAISAFFGMRNIRVNALRLGDDAELLRERITFALTESDIVVLSGGVSMGKFDLIPGVLHGLGVVSHFHRVAQRPGKPIWFGTKGRTAVFALPGNPVSVLACCARYIGPYLSREQIGPTPGRVSLTGAVTQHPTMTQFIPVQQTENGKAVVVRGNGSGDFAALARATGFAEIPSGSGSCSEAEYYPL
jgi:molybdopterin molybdotransferase